jgi:hypothetical protein
MSLPKITPDISGYTYCWESEKITIECRRLSLHSGEIKGEICISSNAPGNNASHLHRANFNFSSDTARDRLATSLGKRMEADWRAILEQTCVYTMDYFRKGETIEELNSDNSEAQSPEFLFYPFVIRNYPTIIFGDPSSSKSLFALIASSIMMLPWYDNPLEWRAPNRPLRLLYLDWETDASTVNWNLSCLQRGMELPPLFLNYLHCSMPLYYDVEQVAEKIVDCKADVIIIDSLGLAVGGDLNATEPALNFWGAWRKLKTTSLILAHTSKNSEEKKKSVYGNVYYTAEARSIWEIRKSQETGSKEMDVALFNRKPPPFTGLLHPQGFHVDFEGVGEISNKIIISQSSPQSVSEFVTAMGTQAQIEELLKEGSKTTSEIEEAVGITNANARNALKRLKDKNKITKLGDGKWGLLALNY